MRRKGGSRRRPDMRLATQMRFEKGRQRPADGTSKAAKQCQRRDRRASGVPIQTAERGKGRIVETGAHAESNQQPAQSNRPEESARTPTPDRPAARKPALDGQDRTTAATRNRALPTHGETTPAINRPDRHAANHPGSATSRCRRRSASPEPPGDSRSDPQANICVTPSADYDNSPAGGLGKYRD